MTRPLVTFNHLLGQTCEGKPTVMLEVLVNGIPEIRLRDPEVIIAFLTQVAESSIYLRDLADQTHLHVTPSTAPTVFKNLAEEQAELVQIQHFTKKDW